MLIAAAMTLAYGVPLALFNHRNATNDHPLAALVLIQISVCISVICAGADLVPWQGKIITIGATIAAGVILLGSPSGQPRTMISVGLYLAALLTTFIAVGSNDNLLRQLMHGALMAQSRDALVATIAVCLATVGCWLILPSARNHLSMLAIAVLVTTALPALGLYLTIGVSYAAIVWRTANDKEAASLAVMMVGISTLAGIIMNIYLPVPASLLILAMLVTAVVGALIAPLMVERLSTSPKTTVPAADEEIFRHANEEYTEEKFSETEFSQEEYPQEEFEDQEKYEDDQYLHNELYEEDGEPRSPRADSSLEPAVDGLTDNDQWQDDRSPSLGNLDRIDTETDDKRKR